MVGNERMRIYFEQIPEEASFKDYPPGTVFVHDDTPLKRDPETFCLIPWKRRPLVYPADAWKGYKKENK